MDNINDSTPPAMRFDDGDVLVKLSSHPDDWLLLHKEILSALCPMLDGASGAGWSAPCPTWHPGKQTWVSMWTLILIYDPESETFFLQTEKTKDMGIQERVGLTHAVRDRSPWTAPSRHREKSRAVLWDVDEKSERVDHKLLCDTKWAFLRSSIDPDDIYYKDTRRATTVPQTVEHMKIFFALLYGTPRDQLVNRIGLNALCNIISYADHYLCLPQIAQQLQRWALECSDEWRSSFPNDFLTATTAKMANAIHCGPLLIDAVRHAMAEAMELGTSREVVAENLGLTISELSALVPEELEARFRQARVKDSLMQTLLTSQLHEISNEIHWWYERGNFDVADWTDLGGRMHNFEGYCNLPAALDIWHTESPPRSSAQMKASMIVSTITSQWIAMSLCNVRIIHKDHRECYPPVHEKDYWPEQISLAQVVKKIQEAAAQDHSYLLVGETTALDYAIANSQGESINDILALTRLIKVQLNDAVKIMALKIKKWRHDMQRELMGNDWAKQGYDVYNVVFKSTENVENIDYFPYVAVVESAVPWKAYNKKAIPQVNRDPASHGFLRELGFFVKKEGMDDDLD